MKAKKGSDLKPLPFTDEQIRAKAYEIWQKYGVNSSPNDNWDAAIRSLKTQQRLQLLTNLWYWTGFGEKRLWDFLQLLIVPIFLTSAGLTLQEFIKQREQQIANDRARQEIFVKYLDQMAELLQKGLLKTKMNSETFVIAQAKSITALQSLDATRQHLVIQFLEAANLNTLTTVNKGILYGARMSKADLREADLSGAILNKANLSGAILNKADLSSANLSGANLTNANVQNSNLSGSNFSGAKLSFTNFSKANLSHSDLSGAILNKADLSSANLSGANLSHSDLSGAILNKADLSSANLSGANLSFTILNQSDLSHSDISGSNFSYTDLSEGKNITDEQLKSAKLCQTKMPDGNTSNRDCKVLELPVN